MDSSRNGKQKQGWFKLDNHFVDHIMSTLNPSAVAAYLVLARHADSRGHCHPSMARLSRLSGVSRRTICRCLSQLEAAGLITRQEGAGQSNRYTLNPTDGLRQNITIPHQGCDKKGGGGETKLQGGVRQKVTTKEDPKKEDPKNKTDASASIGTHGYPDDFEEAWSKYPKRAGGNPKRSAYKAWRARIEAGRSPRELIAGTERYAAFVRATGKERTEYVKQARTFFGPDEPFLETWEVPATGGRRVLPGERYDPNAKDVCDDW